MDSRVVGSWGQRKTKKSQEKKKGVFSAPKKKEKKNKFGGHQKAEAKEEGYRFDHTKVRGQLRQKGWKDGETPKIKFKNRVHQGKMGARGEGNTCWKKVGSGV